MRLRLLETKDAPRMLKWMHDDKVVRYMGQNFSNKTLNDCLGFIKRSGSNRVNFRRVIVDDEDTYVGTVSLKHVNRETDEAEFAIVVSKDALGKAFPSLQ